MPSAFKVLLMIIVYFRDLLFSYVLECLILMLKYFKINPYSFITCSSDKVNLFKTSDMHPSLILLFFLAKLLMTNYIMLMFDLNHITATVNNIYMTFT